MISPILISGIIPPITLNLPLKYTSRTPCGTVNEKYGTFPSAAHGWFAFLKPLQPGNHTVYYQNSVEPTTLSGAGNSNTTQFTYHFKVE
jgi:hypothetical protein